MNARVLVTGASGFIGRALVDELSLAGHRVRAAMRVPADVFRREVEVVAVSDLTRPVEWRLLLKDIDMWFTSPASRTQAAISPRRRTTASIALRLPNLRLPRAPRISAG